MLSVPDASVGVTTGPSPASGQLPAHQWLDPQFGYDGGAIAGRPGPSAKLASPVSPHDALGRLTGQAVPTSSLGTTPHRATPASSSSLAQALDIDPLELLEVTEETTLRDLRGRAGHRRRRREDRCRPRVSLPGAAAGRSISRGGAVSCSIH